MPSAARAFWTLYKDEIMRPSRREFVKWLSAGGISVSLSHLAAAASAPFASHETLPGRGNFNPATKGAGRVDGVAKVTGAKLYASDFRASDMPGWPQTTSHAILVRANDATHVYTGLDLARLSGALKPSVIVTAADLERIGTDVPEFYAGDLFCPLGKTPLYLGQPVALLIFEKFDAFDQARLVLRDGTFVKFGASETMVRPRLDQERVNRELVINQSLITAHGGLINSPFSFNAGNTQLRPYKSTNFDLSLEKYFTHSGYVAVAGFYKKLTDFVDPNNSSAFDFTPYLSQLSPADQATVLANGGQIGLTHQPVNDGHGHIEGF